MVIVVGNQDKVSSSEQDHPRFKCPVPQFPAIGPLNPCLVEQKTKLMHPIILTPLQRHIETEEIQNEGVQTVKKPLRNENRSGL